MGESGMLHVLFVLGVCVSGHVHVRHAIQCEVVTPVSSAVHFQLALVVAEPDLVCDAFLLALAVSLGNGVDLDDVSVTKVAPLAQGMIVSLQCTSSPCAVAVAELFDRLRIHQLRIRYEVLYGINPDGIVVRTQNQVIYNLFKTFKSDTMLYAAPSSTSEIEGEAGTDVKLFGFESVDGFVRVSLFSWANGTCPKDEPPCIFVNSSDLQYLDGPVVAYCSECQMAWQNTSKTCACPYQDSLLP